MERSLHASIYIRKIKTASVAEAQHGERRMTEKRRGDMPVGYMSVVDFAKFVGVTDRAVRLAMQEGRVRSFCYFKGKRILDVESAIMEMNKWQYLRDYREAIEELVDTHTPEDLEADVLILKPCSASKSVENKKKNFNWVFDASSVKPLAQYFSLNLLENENIKYVGCRPYVDLNEVFNALDLAIRDVFENMTPNPAYNFRVRKRIAGSILNRLQQVIKD
jgi:hypothetical protein